MNPQVNLAALLERASVHRSSGTGDVPPALVVGGRRSTAGELFERVARWRGGLVAAGVEPGDRVVLVAANSEEFVIGHLAVMGVGAISVPLNPLSPPPELAQEMSAVAPRAVLADQVGQAGLPTALELLAGAARPLSVLDVTALDAADPVPVVEVASDAVACLIFTSGTAGPPKPAMLTHGNLTAGLQAMLSLPVALVGQNHVMLGLIPLFHVFGLNVVLHMALLIGATLVLDNHVGPEVTARTIAEHRCTFVPGPPAFWQALSAVATPEQMSSVVLALAGASRLAPELKMVVSERFNLELTEGYGLTESSAVVASSIGSDPPLGSVGRLLPGVEARIIDADGDDCLVGDPGELLVRGPMVFPGYWQADVGQNGSAGIDPGPLDADGWLHTGDVAVVDEAGNLAIVDRLKDLIIVSGFNVFPVEVEAVLAAHPDVAEAAVIGEPAETTGEKVVAHVVPVADVEVDPGDLAAHCRANLARYKVPSRFVIAESLPFGPTGKLQRNRLV